MYEGFLVELCAIVLGPCIWILICFHCVFASVLFWFSVFERHIRYFRVLVLNGVLGR